MKKVIAVLLTLWLWLPSVSYAASDVDSLLDKAIAQLARQGYLGDTSTAERYLQAILEQQPEHLEANWLVMELSLVKLINYPLSSRTTALLLLGPHFTRVTKLAKESNQQAYLHYMTAVYASYYKAYERALSEIDKALSLEPDSTRYQHTKAKLLIDYGSWYGRDDRIEEGVEMTRRALEMAKKHPDPLNPPVKYHIQIAWGISELSEPRWKEVVEHYLRYLASAEESMAYAIAWNNASAAYRHMGLCQDAKDAAEAALRVREFGMAKFNKRFAEFCIEMKRLDLDKTKSASPSAS